MFFGPSLHNDSWRRTGGGGGFARIQEIIGGAAQTGA